MHVRVLCICWAALAQSELPTKKKYIYIIFTSSGIVWRVHWKLVQLGAFPAACLSTYPHFAALPIKM